MMIIDDIKTVITELEQEQQMAPINVELVDNELGPWQDVYYLMTLFFIFTVMPWWLLMTLRLWSQSWSKNNRWPQSMLNSLIMSLVPDKMSTI